MWRLLYPVLQYVHSFCLFGMCRLVCLTLLRNLAENLDTERKMMKRKLISFMVPLLHRDNEELVLLVAEFLRKLVLSPENLHVMVTENIVQAVLPLTERGSDAVEKVQAGLIIEQLHLFTNVHIEFCYHTYVVPAGCASTVVQFIL